MRILILNTDYSRFLAKLYGANPGLEMRSYAEQCAVRNETLFGFCDYYPKNFKRHGHEAQCIYVDNLWAQAAWGREHGIHLAVPAPGEKPRQDSRFFSRLKYLLAPYKARLRPLAARLGFLHQLDDRFQQIILAQIEEFQPDIVLNQNMRVIGSDLMRRVRSQGRKLVAQIGVDPPRDADLGVFDFGVSLIPAVVDYFRSRGLKAEQVDLAFEPPILQRLGPEPEKDIPVSFVGSISPSHASRISFLEAIASKHPLSLWVPTLEGIPAASSLHACRNGEVYGREMYNVLRRSRISLNSHIADARGSAGNLRLYEATGVGSMLLTDDLADLPRLFEPDREVVVYKSTSDCIDKIGRYLGDEPARQSIADAGQARTIRDHTFFNRCGDLISHFERL